MISSLRYSTRNHRLGALAHKVAFHNMRGINKLPNWIRQKHKMALSKQLEAQNLLAPLLALPNPHKPGQPMYTTEYFKSQWDDQVTFHKRHSDAETEENERLAAFLDQEATLSRLRTELNNIDNLNPDSYNQVLEIFHEFTETEERQRVLATNLGGVPTQFTGPNAEERKLRLLMWHAKSKLYVHAVELHAEQQPLHRGTPIGTTLSTKILAALERRKRPIQNSLNKFNNYRKDYLNQFAPNQDSLPENQPLTYKVFANLSLHHAFWQDVYLYHSRAPWAISSDIRNGIQYVLTIERTIEEVDLIKQELSSAMSWAVDLHQKLTDRIQSIQQRADERDVESESDSITTVSLGDCEESVKRLLVQHILQDHLSKHKNLILDWALDVAELWDELHKGDHTHAWFDLVESVGDDARTTRNTREVDSTAAAPNRVGNEGNNQANDDYPDDNAADGAGEEVDAAQLMDMLTFDDDEPDYTNNDDAIE
ncbi:hypothetical protein PCANC_12011 [Puccinia coronata f. sp. avenae]|uniref:Uncharacterized protein n=1 Tax=Puccinia coronata f. sp. avenae TaxID=200324 RepID=A0A2N5UUH5_9BASI|nr:hypothetical protein PCANC_12011 [Puccinia coronata f. sp. avenae]